MKIIEDYTSQFTFLEQIELWLQQDEMITVADQKTLTLIHVSQKFATTLGYETHEISGISINSLLAPKGSKRYQGDVFDLVRNAKMIRGINFKCKDGESLPSSVISFEMVDTHPSGIQNIYWVGRIRPSELEQPQGSVDYFF
ncbi:PAS domain-containing protein [Bdellovibrio sp. HCB185ZH]|uniref:PAS domain-containing protein n=1 Tax=Bdellovibrio sp. HCB185ZH TaxID=3394235 RepID=UPI0039A6AD65